MWPATTLAPSFSALKADAAAQLAPVRGIERSQLRADWHRYAVSWIIAALSTPAAGTRNSWASVAESDGGRPPNNCASMLHIRQTRKGLVNAKAWREQAGKEREERRELAQRLALAAPIAAPAPETPTAPEPRRPWWRRLVG